MFVRSFLLATASCVALLGATAGVGMAQTAPAQTDPAQTDPSTTAPSKDTMQGYGNFFRYRIDGLDPSIYDNPVLKVVQPRKFFIGEKADLTINVQGGNRPYAFSLIGPPLAQGLTFDPRLGNFVGTSKVPSEGTYVMAVQDAKGRITQSDPFVVTWLDDFDETQQHAYPVQAFVGDAAMPSPQPIFDGSATTDVPANGFGATVAVHFDHPIRAKTAVVAFSADADYGSCSYDLEAKDEDANWKPVHRAQSLASGGVLSAFNLMPTPRSGFVSADWRVRLTNSCHMRVSELRIASSPPNPPPAWQTPEGLLVAVGPVPLGVSVVAPEQSPYSDTPTVFELASGSTLPTGFAIQPNGDLTGPTGEGFPYGRVDFTLRATDGIGYWTERKYYLTPDAVPARTAYPASVGVGDGVDIRHAMNDGVTDATAQSATVKAGGNMLFDYGRFVRVTGGTVLAGVNVGQLVLEAEAGPGVWVAPEQVAGIAKRWRLVNESTDQATVREARLDAADYNHPPLWQTRYGEWIVGDSGMSIPTRSGPDWIVPGVDVKGFTLTLKADEQTIYSNEPAVLTLAPGATVPDGLAFDGAALILGPGESLPAGRLATTIRATDALGYVSDQQFVFNPANVRANTVAPAVTGPGGDVTMVLNDGKSDASVALAAGDALVWDFGRFVNVAAAATVVADKPGSLVLEAWTKAGWVAPNTVDGIAVRWRARATAAVSVQEYRLDGASPILIPTFSPNATLRTVDQAGVDGSGQLRLPITATARNPYASSATKITVVGTAPAGFSFANGAILVPAGESFQAGLQSVTLQAADNLGVSATQTYAFQPASLRASTLVPQTRDASGNDAYFVLYDGVTGSDARSVHLEAGQAVTFTFQRYAQVAAANAVDATNPSALVFEAQTADGWVPAASVNSIAKAFRARATASVDVREYRLDGAAVPGAPTWGTSAGPYVADESRLTGRTNLALPIQAQVNNTLADPTPVLTVQGSLPDAFTFSANTITAPRGSNFAAGRQTVVLRASDSTGFYADRSFVFNPSSVPAQPLKPDVRDPAGNDVFGVLADGRAESGVALTDGQSVILAYGSDYVNASRPAVVTATGGTVVVEAETASGWVAAADVDWIARRFRVRSVGATFLSEARLDGLDAQYGPYWNNRFPDGVVTITDPATIALSASAQSTFSDRSTVVYSAPSQLPKGFSLSGNTLSIPAGESLPAGYTPITVRATDNVGIYSDMVVPLQPAAPRAYSVRSTMVDPTGKDVYTILTDGAVGANAPGVQLAAGDAVVLDYGQYVYIYTTSVIDASAAVVFEAETASGWVASGTVNNRAKRFRVRATAAGLLREVRLDGLEVQQPPAWNTAGDLRAIDQSGLKLVLSTTLRSRFGAPITYASTTTLPTGFSLTSSGTLGAPAGESFPTGFVSFVVRASDAVGFTADQAFSFAPATVRSNTLPATSITDPSGASVIQVLNDDVKGTSAPGVALTAGQSVVWTFPRYVKIVPSASVVDATNAAALVLETDGGTAGWVAATSLDTGKRFRIRATASTTVREYRLDGVGAYVLPTYVTAAGSYETSSTAVSGQTGLALQVAATNNSPFPGAMTYALVPGTTLPSGFSLTADGIITVASADTFPAGKVSVPVRATDPAGNLVDRTFLFHPVGVSAATVAPKTVVDGTGKDVRVAMLDGRTDTSDVSTVLAAGQSLVYDYGTQWVRVAAASTFDVVPTGAVLETVAADGSWVQMTATPATAFPSLVQDQGGRRFRIRQITGTTTLREARLGGLPLLGPTWSTPATARTVSQTTIQGLSPDSLTLQLASTKSAITASPISYAWVQSFTPPNGFSLTAAGALTVPQGESFPYGRIEAAVRATTDDYTADRTFVLNPATVRLGTIAPTSVLDKSGNSVVVPLYDGATGTSAAGVTLAAGDTIVWTYPRYVQNAAAAVTDGVNLGNVVLEVERTADEWVVPSTMDSIGRRWRLRATGAATLREYRLDGASTFLSPTWVSAGGTRVVTQTGIAGTSPASLSMQLQATNRSLRPNDPLSYALAPGSAALPTGFSMTSAGVLTAPAATDFTAGTINFTIRVTDTLGFFTDQAFNFVPETVAMTAQLPSSVTGPDGSDVFVALYSGLNDKIVPLATQQSITYTFPRYVSPTGASAFVGLSSNPAVVLETPAQDGSWATVLSANTNSPSPAGTSASTAYGKVYRLRNIVGPTQNLNSARLGGVPALAPVWNTPIQNQQYYAVNQTSITWTLNGTKVGTGLQMPLSATMQATGGTGLSYAPTPGTTLPTGFSISSDGTLTVPAGESFPGAYPQIAIRVIDTKGFYNDRVFPFYPAYTQAGLTLPSAVTAPDGSDAFTILYDGNADRTVSVAPGEAVSWTFPNYVSVANASFALSNTVGSASLVLENLKADGTWGGIETWSVSNSTIQRAGQGTFPANVGRQWRLRNFGATGTAVLAEFRIEGTAAQTPSISTASGPWEVTQTAITGASPAALSLQLAAKQTYSGSTSAFTWSLSPTSMALPGNFGLSSSGLVVVPQGEQFGFGLVQLTARATDSRGFYTDRTVSFFPTSPRASTVAPTSVIDADGNDAYSILYDGANDRSVSLAAGASVTYTFPQFVSLQTTSAHVFASNAPGSLVLQRQLQDGSWSNVEVKNNGTAPALQSAIASNNVSKVYRLTNIGTAAMSVPEYRLDASIIRTPAWSTSNAPYFVSENVVSTTSGGSAAAGTSGLTLQVAAVSQSSAAGLVYSLVPGTTLPTGYSISSSGLVTVGPASQMQTNVTVAVRATDGHGLYADRTFTFVPAGTPRANSLPPVAVTGPNGENLLPVLYDGRSDTAFTLAPGDSATYSWDRFVQIASASNHVINGITANGQTAYVLEAPQQDGTWKVIGNVTYNNGYQALLPSGADQYAKTFRIRNAHTAPLSYAEVRLDGALSYGVTMVTSTNTRTVDTAIAGTSPAALSMQLTATGAHPRSTGMTWSLTSALPIGFTLGTDGTLTVPAGTDFPFGFVQVPVQAQDNLGFAGVASYGFKPAGVAARGVTPVSVVGPSGGDLFRPMYDGMNTTSVTLSSGQSITYTFDRFVTVSQIANQSIVGSNHDLWIETPGQNGAWNAVSYIRNGSVVVVNNDVATSKIFRVRNNNSGVAVTINEFPLDGAAYLGPTITTSLLNRTVDASTIVGASPAGLTLQMAATDNYTGAGTLVWTLQGTVPQGFSITSDGVLTVPAGPDFAYGYMSPTVRVTDQGGFYKDAVVPFLPQSVAAKTLPPGSVVGPDGSDLLPTLYDGQSNNIALANNASITYTFDRYVSVSDLNVPMAGYVVADGNYNLNLEVPTQNGGWTSAGVINRYNNGANWSGGITAANLAVSKTFRFRNQNGTVTNLSELRLDNPASYGLTLTQSMSTRTVDQNGISGVSPAAFTLQLGATSGYPGSTVRNWTLTGTVPSAFTLTPDGLITVPAGADFPFGYVSLPTKVTDAKNFAVSGTYTFIPASVRAQTAMPVSVVGPNGEDLRSTLYDGNPATNYGLAAGATVTYTYDRFVSIADVATGSAGYSATMPANSVLVVEVPNTTGAWTTTHVLTSNGSAWTNNYINSAAFNQSKVFRVRNGSSGTATLAEFRLDNPAAYGLTWAQSTGTFFVSDTSISATNGGAAATGTSGLSIPLTATSGYPGGATVSYAFAPGFTPPDGFAISGSTLTVPAGTSFPSGTVSLPIRATDSQSFAYLDRTFTLVPTSVRANTLTPSSVVDASGNSVLIGLYDDDASTASTIVTTLAAGQSVTWTYPQWVNIVANPAVSATNVSTTLYLERQLQDGSWQIVDSRIMSTGVIGGNARGDQYPSKIWRLRNSGSTAAPLAEWRLDGVSSYAPVITTSVATRYVTPTALVTSNGGSTTAPDTSGLTLQFAGTVASPGGGTLSYAWTSGFTPPDGYTLTSAGALTVPARDSMPTGQPLLPVVVTDPRGFAVTRVVPLIADTVRASTRLMPATATVVGPGGSDLFNGMVDGATTAAATLQPNDAITWTFDRYVGLSSATTAKSLSGTTWQLEMPAQAGGWTAVENSSGLLAGSNASRTYRLRNTGTTAITVGEYPIDNAAQGGAPSIAYPAWGDGRYLLNPPYSGTAYSLQIASAQNDPYHPSSLAFAAAGSLPDGVAVSTTGLLTVRENLTAGSNGISIPLVLSNGLGRSTSVTYVLFDQSTLAGIKAFGSTRYYVDGTYAVSCAAYTQGTGTHSYVGATGDGTYRIDPDGSGPAAPTDVACSGMGGSTPTTTIPALLTGSHGYPGNNGSTNRFWVDPSWQTFYLALANVSNGQSFSFYSQTESCYDFTTTYSYAGSSLGSYCGYSNVNFTQTLNRNSGNAFWYDNYRADASINGGNGLTISSPNINFY
jgi:hypothetical protein